MLERSDSIQSSIGRCPVDKDVLNLSPGLPGYRTNTILDDGLRIAANRYDGNKHADTRQLRERPGT